MTLGSILRFGLAGYCFVVSGVCANSLTDGLIAHYPMNEYGENVQDLSGNDRAAYAEYIEIVDGLGGSVFAFDGEKSIISLPEDPAFEITGDYSVSFWVRVEAGSAYIGRIFAQPDFSITSFKGNLRVTVSNPEIPRTGYGDIMGPEINDGEWHHVVLTYAANGEAVLFLDTEEVERGVFAYKPAVSTPTKIGSFGRNFFKGELTDLRVYSRVLDGADVVALRDSKAGH